MFENWTASGNRFCATGAIVRFDAGVVITPDTNSTSTVTFSSVAKDGYIAVGGIFIKPRMDFQALLHQCLVKGLGRFGSESFALQSMMEDVKSQLRLLRGDATLWKLEVTLSFQGAVLASKAVGAIEGDPRTNLRAFEVMGMNIAATILNEAEMRLNLIVSEAKQETVLFREHDNDLIALFIDRETRPGHAAALICDRFEPIMETEVNYREIVDASKPVSIGSDAAIRRILLVLAQQGRKITLATSRFSGILA